jgi:hypothetical protein
LSDYTRPLVLAEVKAIRERLTKLGVLESSAGAVLDFIEEQVKASPSPRKFRDPPGEAVALSEVYHGRQQGREVRHDH